MDPNSALSFTRPTLQTLMWIAIFFAIAALVSALFNRLVRRMVRSSRPVPGKHPLSPERKKTVESLSTNAIAFMAFFIAFLASLGMFVPANTIVWVVGLFSAAFGLAARPLVSDVLTGIGFLFSPAFDIGEKVEFVLLGGNVQGVIEDISLMASQVRAPSGELFSVPNGEIRVVRNFSRGKFSLATITLPIAAEDLPQATETLKTLQGDAFNTQDNLLEPWVLLSASTLSGTKVELTINAKVALGRGPEMRLVLMNLIRDRFQIEGIRLVE
jgi:moderate conductance mechanosensitive channel